MRNPTEAKWRHEQRTERERIVAADEAFLERLLFVESLGLERRPVVTNWEDER